METVTSTTTIALTSTSSPIPSIVKCAPYPDFNMNDQPTEFYFTKILTLIICCFGVVGNILCILILRRKEMKSSFNYLLIGLSICDILILFQTVLRAFQDFRVINLWAGPKVQEIFLFLLDWICTGGAKYFTVAISLERFIAICHPLQAKVLFRVGRELPCTLAVFLFTILISLLSYIYSYHIDTKSFHIYAAIVLHFGPFFLIVVLNILVYLGLKSFQNQRKVLTRSDRKEISITKILLSVVLVFGFCSSFETIRRIILYFDSCFYSFILTSLSDLFYVLNSAINFIIYALVGTKFRKMFFALMRSSCFCLKRDEEEGSTLPATSSSSAATSKDELKREKSEN